MATILRDVTQAVEGAVMHATPQTPAILRGPTEFTQEISVFKLKK